SPTMQTAERPSRPAVAAAVAAAPSGPNLSATPTTADWPQLAAALDGTGAAVLPALLDAGQCAQRRDSYLQSDQFRSRGARQRQGFGRGEYQYFRYPLPPLIEQLRNALYAPLAQIANRWSEALGSEVRYPATLREYLQRCHAAGQRRPTPLLLRYTAGDYN